MTSTEAQKGGRAMDEKDRRLFEMILIRLTTLEPYLRGIADVKEEIKTRLFEDDDKRWPLVDEDGLV
jgi:hypothetical protein